MRIWLITVGEPIPTDGDNERLLRTGILAKFLTERGHEVVWWTSTFDHPRKRHRFDKDTSTCVNERYKIKHLHALGYKRNISLKRLIDHYIIAQKFKKMALAEPVPQIILCSLPPLELCLEATKYGRRTGIPVILDMRDLWPDIFLDVVPSWSRALVKTLLSPMFRTIRRACKQATAIVGITPPIVTWGVNYAGRLPTGKDRAFPHGYTEKEPPPDAIEKANKYWEKQKIGERPDEFVVCFFAGLGHHIELDTVIAAARKLQQNNAFNAFRFVLCGNFDRHEKLAQDCQNVLFPGWVGAAEIWTLMRRSTIGLVPIRSRLDFMASIPNKAIEYMSAGLPIVSSLKGHLEQILRTNECGFYYRNADPDSLIEILQHLNEHPELVRSYSKNAYCLYREQFTASKVYNEMGDYLEEMGGSK